MSEEEFVGVGVTNSSSWAVRSFVSDVQMHHTHSIECNNPNKRSFPIRPNPVFGLSVKTTTGGGGGGGCCCDVSWMSPQITNYSSPTSWMQMTIFSLSHIFCPSRKKIWTVISCWLVSVFGSESISFAIFESEKRNGEVDGRLLR